MNGASDGRIIGCLASMGAGARLNRPPTRKRFCSSKKGVRDRSLELFSKFLPARKLSRSSANENDCAFFKRKTLALDISSASRAKVDGFTLDRALRTVKQTPSSEQLEIRSTLGIPLRGMGMALAGERLPTV